MTLYLGDTPIAGGVTIDQTYDRTSVNAQSGVAINGAGFLTATVSKNTKGYIKFSNGVIIQWGHISSANGAYEESFATSFTSTPVVTVTRVSGSTTTSNANVWIRGRNTTKFNIYTSAATGVSWIAIGY